MRILITGASGFIGSRLTRALIRRGHRVIAGGRYPQALAAQFNGTQAVKLDFGSELDPRELTSLLEGVDIFINAVGIIAEQGRQSFAQLHSEAPKALFAACADAGVTRIIQVSALGADAGASSRYHQSKRAADSFLKELPVDSIIIKPSIVYGPGGRSAAFFKACASLPFAVVVEGGTQRVQPIHVQDLVQCIVEVVQTEGPLPQEIEAVGPAPIQFRDMLQAYRRWLGRGDFLWLISLPQALALRLGKLGGLLHNPWFTVETVQMLAQGNAGDASTISRLLGHPPQSMQAALQEEPATEGDRWHARLYFLKPVLRWSIAFLWIFTGICSAFLYPMADSYALLAQTGITGPLAPLALHGAAALDILLGVALLARFKIRLMAFIQIALIATYTIIISLFLPELWLHPFGPISKNIPVLAAILVMLALEEK